MNTTASAAFPEEFSLPDEGFAGELAGVDREAFDEFLDGFGDTVEAAGERFDVFALERGDEGFAELFGDEAGDLFILPAALDEIVEVAGAAVGLNPLEIIGQEFGAGERFLGAGFEEVVELLVFAEEFLERDHEAGVASGLRNICETKIRAAERKAGFSILNRPGTRRRASFSGRISRRCDRRREAISDEGAGDKTGGCAKERASAGLSRARAC
jgi:hypothetical protein